MVLFTILTLIAVLLTVVAVVILSVGGTLFIVPFADLIICVALIIFIMRRLFRKKKK